MFEEGAEDMGCRIMRRPNEQKKTIATLMRTIAPSRRRTKRVMNEWLLSKSSAIIHDLPGWANSALPAVSDEGECQKRTGTLRFAQLCALLFNRYGHHAQPARRDRERAVLRDVKKCQARADQQVGSRPAQAKRCVTGMLLDTIIQ